MPCVLLRYSVTVPKHTPLPLSQSGKNFYINIYIILMQHNNYHRTNKFSFCNVKRETGC